MKSILIIFLLANIPLLSMGQQVYTSRIGSKYFPGHLDIVITTNHSFVIYELFDHWYTGSYRALRQLKIPMDSLAHFNTTNDSINISVSHKVVRLTDKRYSVNTSVKNVKLCTSPDIMRKVSYAVGLAVTSPSIKHYELYTADDLLLSEEKFRQIVEDKLEKLKNATH